MEKENKSIDECINNFKPPYFGKIKKLLNKQIKHWSLGKKYKN